MRRWDIQAVIGIIGIFGVAAGLVFVGVQVRQANDIAYAEALTWMEESRLISHQAIIDNAEVWRKGCAGDALSADDHIVFEYLIRNEIVIMRYRYLRALFFDPMRYTPGRVLENTVKIFGTCPAMKDEFMKHSPDYWYPIGNFTQALHDEIAGIDD